MAWHWRAALIDGALLGVFMLSAATFGVLLFHPDSIVARRWASPLLRRIVMGLAMGATATALIYSPWGRTSGAHMNPAVTLAFLALGKVSALNAMTYAAAHFIGAVLGVLTARGILGVSLMHKDVNGVATLPGRLGVKGAAVGEFVIAFTQLLVVLVAANIMVTHVYTGLIAGVMVAAWIVLVAPISGMSMNPARTLASAVLARQWRGLWVYLVVPPAAMLSAAGVFVELDGRVFCAKTCHMDGGPCPFECEFGKLAGKCDSCTSEEQQKRQ